MDFSFVEFLYLLFLNLCIYYFKFMYLIYRFILFELCLLFFEFIYLLFLTIQLFFFLIHYYFKTCLLLYPFYDLMIFIYNQKELKLTRKQYK